MHHAFCLDIPCCGGRVINSSSGYNFPSREAIRPYLEPAGQGPSAEWARETARRYRCKVCVGYPEVERVAAESDEQEQGEKYYNSLLVVDENGELILNYRKAFLYYTDETWAAEGDAARGALQLAIGGVPARQQVVDTSFGICMDINPYKFEAPFTEWEFANRVLDSKSQLVVLSMAWLTLLSKEELNGLAEKPDLDTFNYWVQRFFPLIKRRMGHDAEIDGDAGAAKKIVIVFANRTGEEPNPGNDPPARYAGTSAIVAVTQRLRAGQAGSDDAEDPHATEAFDVKILCWDMMGATTEGICFADTAQEEKMMFELVKASG